MDIKTQLIDILKKEDYTFSQLSDHLNMSEDDLTAALNNKTLELRSLELISKALKVPLYSFFRSESKPFDYTEKPYYVNKLWTGDDKTKNSDQISQEIMFLKKIIELKEEQLRNMNS